MRRFRQPSAKVKGLSKDGVNASFKKVQSFVCIYTAIEGMMTIGGSSSPSMSVYVPFPTEPSAFTEVPAVYAWIGDSPVGFSTTNGQYRVNVSSNIPTVDFIPIFTEDLIKEKIKRRNEIGFYANGCGF